MAPAALLEAKWQCSRRSGPAATCVSRIVAYSDSEGEDEPFRLTRRRKKQKEDGEQTEAEEEIEEEPSTSNGSTRAVKVIPKQIIRSERRIFRAAR